MIDHPFSLNLRLRDKKWHTKLCYRVLEHNECDSDAPMTPVTGSYLEEIFADGKEHAIWNFAE